MYSMTGYINNLIHIEIFSVAEFLLIIDFEIKKDS